MTPEEILAKSAEDMSQHGQCKRQYYSDYGAGDWRRNPACAYGVMARVAGLTGSRLTLKDGQTFNVANLDTDDFEDSAAGAAAIKLAETVARLHPEHQAVQGCGAKPVEWHAPHVWAFDLVTAYNDHDTTTKEDMVLAFKEAAHG